MTPAHYLRMGSALGLSPAETLGMEPGLVFDLWELFLQENRREEE